MPGADKWQASLGVQVQVLLLITQYQHQRLINDFVHRQRSILASRHRK